MKKSRLPRYLSEFRDRHGKIRIRFRRGGVSVYMKATPSEGPKFLAEYHALLEGADPRAQKRQGAREPQKGTMDALCAAFYQSPMWRALRPSTQQTYRNIIEHKIREPFGFAPIRDFERRHIQIMVDRMADTPAAANNFLSVLRLLMKYAIRLGMRNDNPCRDVEKIKHKSGGFHTWSEEEIEQFREYYPLGTVPRLALELLLGTGQRRSDVVRMGPQHIRDRRIAVVQQKTGTRLDIPIHPDMAEAINATETGDFTFLITRYGRPFNEASFTNRFRKWSDDAGLSVGCTPHGLRKAAARRLAEAGCSVHEIMSITGHQTLREVERYTRDANMVSLSDRAMDALVRTGRERKLSNPVVRLDKKSI